MKDRQHVTLDIRSYLLVPRRDDRYHHTLAIIQKKMIRDWINKTNSEIENRDCVGREFDRFIQLYFILSNSIKKSQQANPQILANPSDTELITLFLPKYIDSNWNTIGDRSTLESAAMLLYLSLQYHYMQMKEKHFFAGTGIQSSNRSLLIDTKTIGYYKNTTSFEHSIITDADYISYKAINEYNKFKKEKFASLLGGSLRVIYAIRNNFFHGTKRKIESQDSLIKLVNLSILEIIKILHSINSQNFWSELRPIEEYYKENLIQQIKERIKRIFENDSKDIIEWSSLTESSTLHLSFSYYFVILERMKSIIEKSFILNFKDVIEAIKHS